MSKNKLIRNSTAEFLIFTAQDGKNSIEARYENETIWLTQKLMGELFEVGTNTVNYHLKEFAIKGFVLDKKRLENGSYLNENYFEELLAEIAKDRAETEFEKYRIVQDRLFQSDFDKLIMKELDGGGSDE